MSDASRGNWRDIASKIGVFATAVIAMLNLSGGWTVNEVAMVAGGIVAGLLLAFVLMGLVRTLFRPLPGHWSTYDGPGGGAPSHEPERNQSDRSDEA